MLVNEIKYSAALQKFCGYNKEEADFIACNYNNKIKKGLTESLLCYPDPDEQNNKIKYTNIKDVFCTV